MRKFYLWLFVLLYVNAQHAFSQIAAQYGTSTGSGTPAGWVETSIVNSSPSGTYVEMIQSGSTLTTPAINFTNGACTGTWLYVDARTFGGVSGNSADIRVDVSVNNGSTWTLGIYTITPTNTTFKTYGGYDVSSYTGSQVKFRFKTVSATGSAGVGIGNIIIDEYCTSTTTIGPIAMSAYDGLNGAGFDANCNLDAYNLYYTMGSNSTGTAVSAGTATETPMWATFYIPAACTATVNAEYGYPDDALGVCPDSRMDAGDKVGIANSAVTSAQITGGSAVNVGMCGYNAASSGGTGSTGVVSTGCTGTNNTDETVKYVTTGPSVVSVWGNADRSDEIILYSLNVSSAACKTTIVTVVLPIELISFVAFKNGENITLKWATETETDNNYFMAEYSLDAVNFTPFSEVKGAGNSYVKKEYNCLFTGDIGSKTPYFRLKQVDNNGNFTYSPIIMLGTSIGMPSSNQSKIKAYYNTQTSKIITRFSLDFPQEVTIGLYDLTGAKLYETSQQDNEGDHEMLISPPAKEGIYILMYQNGNAAPVRKKIVVSE